MMNEAEEKGADRIEIFRRLSPEGAGFLRRIITAMGLADFCPLTSCKRARACATRQVLCWQVNHDDLTPRIMSILAHDWQRRTAAGEYVPIAPVEADHFKRILAREAAGEPEPSGAALASPRYARRRRQRGNRAMIRVGIGGWTFAPWRGTFYPEGLKHDDELSYAASKLTSIEINGTFYRTQSPASFAKWRDETPDDFVFAVKGHRAVVNKKVLAEAGEAMTWFLKSGVTELAPKLGPLLWQFAPFKKFDADDFGAFLALLPEEADGVPLRHVVEVRHASFLVPEFVALLRKHNVAVVFAESDDYPMIADVTADFVYARLQKSEEKHDTGYAPRDLDRFAALAKTWAAGGEADDLPRFGKGKAKKAKRDVFVYMIAGDKVRAPAAAMALIERL